MARRDDYYRQHRQQQYQQQQQQQQQLHYASILPVTTHMNDYTNPHATRRSSEQDREKAVNIVIRDFD